MIKLLFSDLFQQKNVKLETDNENSKKNQGLIVKANQWLINKDNYDYKPNINIIVKIISPYDNSIFNLFSGGYQIYGPEILNGYKVELYYDENDEQFYELWLANDSNKTDYLIKGDQILGKINDKKLHERIRKYIYNSNYNVFELSKHNKGLANLIKINGVVKLFK